MTFTRIVRVSMMALALGVATLASAQEVVRKEAPPEIRALFQALAQGANGDAAAWESFAQAHFTPERIQAMKVRERIRALVWHRLELMAPAREAVRTGLSILATPRNVPLALAAGWRSADLVWRLAGDTATDYNHYTKRLILSGVYGSTLLVWLDDQSEGWMESAAFLDRRLADVMRFEKWKANWKGNELHRPSLSRFLGRLRYPAR
jgi:ubiquinone biosynthesis protein COQ9